MLFRTGTRIVFIPVEGNRRIVPNQVTIGSLDQQDEWTYSMRIEQVHKFSILVFADMPGWKGPPFLTQDADSGVVTISSSQSGDEYRVSLVKMDGELRIVFEAIVPRYIVPEGKIFEGSRFRFIRARGETKEGMFWIDSFDDQKIEKIGDNKFEFILRNVTNRSGNASLFASIGEWRGSPSVHVQSFTKALVIVGEDEDVYYNITTEEREGNLAIVFSLKETNSYGI